MAELVRLSGFGAKSLLDLLTTFEHLANSGSTATRPQRTLEEELVDLVRIVGEKSSRAVLRRFGWDGRGGATLEEAGAEVGITRERVRQLCEKVLQSLRGWRLSSPTLDRVLQYIAESTPGPADKIEAGLLMKNLTRSYFRLEGVRIAAELLNREVTFNVIRLGTERIVVPQDSGALINTIVQRARRSVEHWGATTVEDVAAQMSERNQSSDVNLVRQILSAIQDFRWLDESTGWFWLVLTSRNRLLNQIRKILSVAEIIDVAELRAGVGRHYRMQGFAPPKRVILELCRQVQVIRVDGNSVSADPPLNCEDVLSDTELKIFRVLKHNGSVMHREEFEKACLAAGVNRATFFVYLDNSPIITKYAVGVYGVRGFPVDPGVVEQLTPKRQRGKVLLDYGWTEGGQIWLSYRLSPNAIETGVISIPAGMRNVIEGSFALRTDDGTHIGSLTMRGYSAWGLSPLFRRRGGEVGDFLTVFVDLKNRVAIASLGDASETGSSLPLPGQKGSEDLALPG